MLDIRAISCTDLKSVFISILNQLVHLKVRYIRANNSPFMNKSLCKAIMVRSRLKNKFFYENLNPNSIIDNKKFWKQVKPLFADKSANNTQVTLLEDGDILTSTYKCAEVLNNFFTDSVNDLGIDRSLHVEPVIDANSPLDRAIKMYKNHPSIICSKNCGYVTLCFSFKPITREHVHQIISKLDTSKAFQRDDIPQKILKANKC